MTRSTLRCRAVRRGSGKGRTSAAPRAAPLSAPRPVSGSSAAMCVLLLERAADARAAPVAPDRVHAGRNGALRAFADDRSPPDDDRQTHVRTTRALFSNFVGAGW